MQAIAPRLARPMLGASRQVLRSTQRLAHTAAHEHPAAHPMMKPVLWTASVGTASGLFYALSRSTGRIGSRYSKRNEKLDKVKWFKETEGDKIF